MAHGEPPRLCFFAERQVGIGVAAAAIEPHVRARKNTTWVDVTYVKDGGVLEALPLPGRMGGTLRGFLQTSAGLRAGPFDALIFLTHNPAVLQQQAIRGVRTLLWTDVTPALLDTQAEHYDHAVSRRRLTQSLKHALVRRTFLRAALCVGWSEWARRSFVNDYGVSEASSAVVSPGVDLELWKPGHAASGPPRLVFVGGHFRRKGGDLLLEVFRSHLRGRCELDIVTRDPVESEPGVTVHRDVAPGSERLRALYRAGAAFVLPTRGDCFSIAGLEAMASGLPLVISAIGGIPEIVEPGKSGYLIAPGDGAALRQAVEALVADPAHARALGTRGRELAERRFDARGVADRLVALALGA